MLFLTKFVHVGVCSSVCASVQMCSCVYAALFLLKQRRCQGELAPLRLNAQRA